MPTTELNRPQQAGPQDAILAVDDVEALLSQADALMNDVQANLGEQDADEVPTTNEGALHDMAEDITSSIETADHDAIMALLNPQSPDANSEETVPDASVAGVTNAVDLATEAGAPERSPTSASGPQSLSEAWLDESNTSDDMIPSIPDDQSSTLQVAGIPVAADVAVAQPAMPKKRLGRALRWILLRLVRLPLDILILLDRPFAGMAPRTKAFIGYAAISTTIVAISTWIYGNIRHTS